MLDVGQFRKVIIRPALEAIDLHSEAAEELLLGTAMQESRLTYLKQLGDGPALGLFQMEPLTHDDIWDNFLVYRESLGLKVSRLSDDLLDNPEIMIWNLYYAAAMCRVHYFRVSAPLPDQGDIPAQAAYWKKYYNTPLGAGTEQEYLHSWDQYC